MANFLALNFARADTTADKIYEVNFSASFDPERGVVQSRISVEQNGYLLRVLDFSANAQKYSNFSGDGTIEHDGKRLIWTLPATGGTLTYTVLVEQERGLLLDARMTEGWAILRLGDLFPPARVRSRAGAISRSQLELNGPQGWLFESRYGSVSNAVNLDNPNRRFDRPSGWLAAGKLGIRRETISQRKVTVAAPMGQGMRRLDIIAFLNWTLPELIDVFPDFPERLLVVGARDDMWRGGLSGPSSIYLYALRPLISENSTSALLHELIHTASSPYGKPRDDWIIEGLAEYYSLEILRRSGGISQKRFDQAILGLYDWAQRDKGRLMSPSSSANTARAVCLLDDIQKELENHAAGSLDKVVQNLLKSEAVDGRHFQIQLENALGTESRVLREAMEKYTTHHKDDTNRD